MPTPETGTVEPEEPAQQEASPLPAETTEMNGRLTKVDGDLIFFFDCDDLPTAMRRCAEALGTYFKHEDNRRITVLSSGSSFKWRKYLHPQTNQIFEGLVYQVLIELRPKTKQELTEEGIE
ncbi:MAG: hypothetical protein Q7R85_03020 [bacterium]|nr:hypothetical protein [bacterium]